MWNCGIMSRPEVNVSLNGVFSYASIAVQNSACQVVSKETLDKILGYSKTAELHYKMCICLKVGRGDHFRGNTGRNKNAFGKRTIWGEGKFPVVRNFNGHKTQAKFWDNRVSSKSTECNLLNRPALRIRTMEAIYWWGGWVKYYVSGFYWIRSDIPSALV